MKALVLAAGLGKRLGLKDIPKPMYKINSKPILEHNILLLKKYNVNDICINLHYKGDVIKDYFEDGKKWGIEIQYSFEKELLGTSGAVKNVSWFWDKSPFFVMYGDNLTAINLKEMLDLHISSKPIATIAVFNPDAVENSGIAGGFVKMDNNNIISFMEGIGKVENGYVNAGVYVMEPDILNTIPTGVASDFGRDIFPKLIKDGSTLKGYTTKSHVIAVDTKEALEKANHILKILKKGEFSNDNN